jgi:hypothetical protein
VLVTGGSLWTIRGFHASVKLTRLKTPNLRSAKI